MDSLKGLKQKQHLQKAKLLASLHLTHLAGDVVDVVAVHQLGRDGKRDQLSSGVVVFLLVPQLGRQENIFLNV